MVPQRVAGRALPFLAVALIALLLGGCVRVITQQKTLDTPLGMKNGEPIPAEPEVTVRHEFTGNQLVVSVMEQPRCRIEKFQVVDRTEVIERQAEDRNAILWEYGVAALLAGLGAYFVVDADRACAKDNDSPEGEGLSPGTCKGVGYGLIGLGGVSLGVGVWDTFKTRDSSKHVGRVEIPQGTSMANCGSPGPASGRLVKLDLGGNLVLEDTTDSSGRVALSFPAGRPLPIEANPAAATVHVGSLAPIAVNASRIVPPSAIEARQSIIDEEERQRRTADASRRLAEQLRQKKSIESKRRFDAMINTPEGMWKIAQKLPERSVLRSREMFKSVATNLGLSPTEYAYELRFIVGKIMTSLAVKNRKAVVSALGSGTYDNMKHFLMMFTGDLNILEDALGIRDNRAKADDPDVDYSRYVDSDTSATSGSPAAPASTASSEDSTPVSKRIYVFAMKNRCSPSGLGCRNDASPTGYCLTREQLDCVKRAVDRAKAAKERDDACRCCKKRCSMHCATALITGRCLMLCCPKKCPQYDSFHFGYCE